MLPIGISVLMGLLGLFFHKVCIAAHPLYIFFYIVACCYGSYSYYTQVTQQQIFCAYTEGRIFDITGTIIDIRKTTNPHLCYCIVLKLSDMKPADNQSLVPVAHEKISLYLNTKKNLRISDTIRIRNVKFKSSQNNEFMKFLLKEHITTSVSISQNSIELLKRPNLSLSRTITEYRNELLGNFRRSMDRETFLAFSSIFLGDPLAKKREDVLKNQLKTWGLFHYIARAGLHLVIFVSIWVFIFNLLPISWSLRQILIILLCSLYYILTWPSLPFNRAFFTVLLVRICGLLGLKTYYVPTLALIAFITIIENPCILFALDFQLSFGVTFGLAWFNEVRYLRYKY
jgi:ComEC/Rec2-related protein